MMNEAEWLSDASAEQTKFDTGQETADAYGQNLKADRLALLSADADEAVIVGADALEDFGSSDESVGGFWSGSVAAVAFSEGWPGR